MDQICPKRAFLIKNEKSEHQNWIAHVRISVGTKFQLKLIILIFLDQICPKRVLLIKNRKSEHHHWILRILISVHTKFQIKLINLIFLDQICPKRLFPLGNKKSEQHHWILHIRIRLGAIFLGAMALLGQSRESWPSMAPLGHVENSQIKMLWHF